MAALPLLITEGSAFIPLAFITAFLAVSAAVGRRVLILFGAVEGTGILERLVLSVCIGAGVLQFVPFTLGLSGHFDTRFLKLAAVAICLLAAADLYALAKAFPSLTSLRRTQQFTTNAWILALSPAALMALVTALCPSLDPDGLTYHLTVPKRWMATGHFDYLPTYPYANAPMGMELLFGWAMAIAGDSAAKCVHWSLGLLAVVAIFLVGRRLGNRMTGMIPATVFLVGPAGAAGILGFSYVEGGASLAISAAVLAWLIAYQQDKFAFLRIAVFLAATAASFKISAAIFPAALFLLTITYLCDQQRKMRGPHSNRNTTWAIMSLLPFAMAPIVPWLLRAFLLTGNPFFPVLAGQIESRDLSPELARQVDSYTRLMTWGNSLGREWGVEQRVYLLIAVAIVFLVVCAIAIRKFPGRMTRSAAVIVTVTALAQLYAVGLYLRYWLPISAALLPSLAALLGTWIAQRRVLVIWIVATLACSTVQAMRIYQELGRDLPGIVKALAGGTDRQEFLRQRLPIYPLYLRVNDTLPSDARILMSGYCGGFYMDRTTYCAEMVQTALKFGSWAEFAEDIRRLGVTHVIAPTILATSEPIPLVGASAVSVVTREQQYSMMRQLLTEHADKIQTESDQTLFELR